MDITAILSQVQTVPSYTPPMTLEKLGVLLFDAKEAAQADWPPTVRKAYFWALRASAWADGSAELVRKGEQVTL